jgi:DNA polymerase-4
MKNTFSPWILHLDGDAFFASVEVALRRELVGKPVVVGGDRGIACAMSYEAKRLGVVRAMPSFQIRKLFPQVIILPSNFHLYELFSERMFRIVERYTPYIERYSIDECFAWFDSRFTSVDSVLTCARNIQNDIHRELGITVTCGISCSKVLAKVASKQRKPNGFTYLPLEKSAGVLSCLDIGSVWGIGGETSQKLRGYGISTAQDFVSRSREWVYQALSKPFCEIWHELRGESVLLFSSEYEPQKSISNTRSFGFTSSEESYIYAELSKNIENACKTLRKQKLVTRQFSIFLKTKEGRFITRAWKCIVPTCSPEPILQIVRRAFTSLCTQAVTVKATGITCSDLVSTGFGQDLFGYSKKAEVHDQVHQITDTLDHRFGAYSVVMASSLASLVVQNKKGGEVSSYSKTRPLSLPCMGNVF